MPHGAEERAVRRAVARAKSSVRIVVSGIGPHAAVRAAAAVSELESVRRVVVTGLCGVLSPTLSVGEALVYSELLGSDGDVLALDRPFVRALGGAVPGSQTGIRAIESATIVTRAADKRSLAARSGAQAVDMESYAIAAALASPSIAVGVLRVASDDLAADLPALDRTLNGSGGIDGFAFSIALARRPFAGVRLIRDGLRSLAALERAIYAVCASAPPAGRS